MELARSRSTQTGDEHEEDIEDGGAGDETLALASDCRKLFVEGSIDIYTPAIGAVVDASVDTNAWVVKLAPALVKQLKWQSVRGLSIATVTGRLVAMLKDGSSDKDATLGFPYLKEGRYCIRITEDANRNSFVDTGSVLERRQPEKVMFYEIDGESFIDIPAATEILQTIDIAAMFKD